MSYTNTVVQTVRERFEQKRLRAEEDVKARELEAALKCPEIAEITRQLDATGLRVLQSAMQGSEGLEARIEAMKRENKALQERRKTLLLENGFAEDYLSLKPECPKCGDTGIVGGKNCECFKKELAKEAYRSSGLGAVLDSERFETFDLSYYSDVKGANGISPRENMEYIFKQAKLYAASFDHVKKPDNLLFIGSTGLGKTHLSTAIAAELIEKGTDVVYETVQSIISEYEKKTFRYDPDAAEAVDRYLGCELLIIDDLGTEFRSSFTQSVLYELLNTRINEGRPMIVSTNLSGVSDFQKQYDDRTVSRLVGSFRSFKFTGEDVRIQKVKQNKQ